MSGLSLFQAFYPRRVEPFSTRPQALGKLLPNSASPFNKKEAFFRLK